MPHASRGKRQHRPRLQGNSDYTSGTQTKTPQARIETELKKSTDMLFPATESTTVTGTKKNGFIPYGKMDSNGNLVPVLPTENQTTMNSYCDSTSTTDNEPTITSGAQNKDIQREVGSNKDSTEKSASSEKETNSWDFAKGRLNNVIESDKATEISKPAGNVEENKSDSNTSRISPEKGQVFQRSLSAPAVEQSENKDKHEQSNQSKRRPSRRFRSSSQRSNTSNDSGISRRSDGKNANYDRYGKGGRSRGRFNERMGYNNAPHPWQYRGNRPFPMPLQSSAGYRPNPPFGFSAHNEVALSERDRMRYLNMATLGGAHQFRHSRNRFPMTGHFPGEVQMRSYSQESHRDRQWSAYTHGHSGSRAWRQDNKGFRRQRSYGTSGRETQYEQLQDNEAVRLNGRSHSENMVKHRGPQSYTRPSSFPRPVSDTFREYENNRFLEREEKRNRLSRFEHFYDANSFPTLSQELFQKDHNKFHSTPYTSPHQSTKPIFSECPTSLPYTKSQKYNFQSNAIAQNSANSIHGRNEPGCQRDEYSFQRQLSTPLSNADIDRFRSLSLDERTSAKYNPASLVVHCPGASRPSIDAPSNARSVLPGNHDEGNRIVNIVRTEEKLAPRSRKVLGLPSQPVFSNLIYPAVTEMPTDGQERARRNQGMPEETRSTLRTSDQWLVASSTEQCDLTGRKNGPSQTEGSRAEEENCLNPRAPSFRSMIAEEINEEMARAQSMSIPMSYKPKSRDRDVNKELNPNANDFVPTLRDGYGNAFVMTVSSKGLCTFRPTTDQIQSNPDYVISTSADEAMQGHSERNVPISNTDSFDYSQMAASTKHQGPTRTRETHASNNHQPTPVQYTPVIESVAPMCSGAGSNQSHLSNVMTTGLYNSPVTSLTPSVLVPVSAPPQPSEAFVQTHQQHTPAYSTIQGDYSTIPLNYISQPTPEYATTLAMQPQIISPHPQTPFTNTDYTFPSQHMTPAIVYVTSPPIQASPVTPLLGNACFSDLFMHHEVANSVPNPATTHTQLVHPLYHSAPELVPTAPCLQMRVTETIEAPVFNLFQAVQTNPVMQSDIPNSIDPKYEQNAATNLKAMAYYPSQITEVESCESLPYLESGQKQCDCGLGRSHSTNLKGRLKEAISEVRACLGTEYSECSKMAQNLIKLKDFQVEDWRLRINAKAFEERSPEDIIFEQFLALRKIYGDGLTTQRVTDHFMSQSQNGHQIQENQNERNVASSNISDNEASRGISFGRQPVYGELNSSSQPQPSMSDTPPQVAAISPETDSMNTVAENQSLVLSSHSDLIIDDSGVRDVDIRRQEENVTGVHQAVQILQNGTNTTNENRRSSLGNVNIGSRILYWESNVGSKRKP